MKMLHNLGIISIVLFMSQLLSVVQQCASSNVTWVCKGNKVNAIRVSSDRRTCYCLSVPSIESRSSDDGYKHTPGIGIHKFYKVGKEWNDARKTCIKDGAHLAIINSKKKLLLLNNQFKNEYTSVKEVDRADLAYVDIPSQFKRSAFTPVLGESHDSNGFKGWNTVSCSKWGPQPDNQIDKDGNGQNCQALIRECDSVDDYWCNQKLPFFCEKPDICT